VSRVYYPRAVASWAMSIQVDLTSRPSRAAANRLYERLGFQPRDSQVYRFTVQAP
jgi:ribosomal protein S18 acetylase RimI-like enzyme